MWNSVLTNPPHQIKEYLFRDRTLDHTMIFSARYYDDMPNISHLEWKEIENDTQLGVLYFEALKIEPCPFCKHIPKITGYEEKNGNKWFAHPHTFNVWYLNCCKWAAQIKYNDPIRLIEERNKLLEIL